MGQRRLRVLAGCAVLAPAVVFAEVDHRLGLSVVQIHAYGGDARTFFGSGVVVGPDRVVTNCHVTRTAKAVVIAKGGMRFPASSQRADALHDLCLLEAPGLAVPSARLGSASALHVGDTVYFYGFPRAIGMAFSQGRVEALHPFEGAQIIETSADFTSGASGGAIFDDGGRLTGLATFLPSGHSTHTFAIPIDWLQRVEQLVAQPVAPFNGASFWENPAGLPALLRVPDAKDAGAK